MSFLLSPIAVLLIATAIALIGVLAQRRWVLMVGLLGNVGGLALMTPLVANALLLSLESRADPAPGECDGVEAVVLLAGGIHRPAGEPADFGALTWSSLQRAFVYLDRGHDSRLPLVIAGGSRHTVSESQVLGELLQRLNLGADPLVLESDSLSTDQNAREVRRLAPDLRRIGLATSARHMPRARRAFVVEGFEVCRLPLDRWYVDASGPWAFWPQASALAKTEAALHEIAGDLYYRWKYH